MGLPFAYPPPTARFGTASVVSKVNSFSDIRDAKVDRRATLCLLARRCHTHQQTHWPHMKKAIWGGAAKRNWNAESVTVERRASLKILNRDQDLSNRCI